MRTPVTPWLALLLATAMVAPAAAVLADDGRGDAARGPAPADGARDGAGGADGGADAGRGGNGTEAPGNGSLPAPAPGATPAPPSGNPEGGRGDDGGRGEAGARGDHAGGGGANADNVDWQGFRQRADDAREACRERAGPDRAACEAGVAAMVLAFAEDQRSAYERERDDLVNRTASPDERLGGFALVNGTWTGRFVSFRWDAAKATLLDYTVDGVLVFDNVTLAGIAPNATVSLQEEGRTARVGSGGGALLLHDNPGGVLNARGEDAPVAFVVSASLRATMDGDGLSLAGPGNFSATLHGADLAFANGTATASGEATFVAHEENVVLPGVANDHRAAIETAKAEDRVGAEVTVAGPDARDVEAQVLDAPLHLNVTTVAPGDVRLVVNGTGLGPRTLVINVAASVLQGDELNITYSDLVNGTFRAVPIVEAESLANVLDPENSSVPLYWVVHDRDGVQVLVSVPHFSTHALEVQSFGPLGEVPPSVLAGSLAAVLFVAAAGTGLLRRKR